MYPIPLAEKEWGPDSAVSEGSEADRAVRDRGCAKRSCKNLSCVKRPCAKVSCEPVSCVKGFDSNATTMSGILWTCAGIRNPAILPTANRSLPWTYYPVLSRTRQGAPLLLCSSAPDCTRPTRFHYVLEKLFPFFALFLCALFFYFSQ